MSSSSETTDTPSRQYPRQALSKATSRRLLRELLERAEGGDNGAAEALVRLARDRCARFRRKDESHMDETVSQQKAE